MRLLKPALWIILFLFSLTLRLYQYRTTPGFVGPDEIQYLSEASALIHSGHDITGNWTPWTLTSSNTWYAELPGVLLTPAVLLFSSDPLLAAHLTHIILGTLLPFVLALFAYALFRNYRLSYSVALLAILNPWLFQFSRLAFESYFSLFLFFSGFTLFVFRRSWAKLQALLPLTLGFFQYQGHKTLLLPFILLFSFYLIARDKKLKAVSRFGPPIVVSIFVFLLTSWFVIRLPTQTVATRATAQFTFLNLDTLGPVVDASRKLSLENPFQPLFTNKATVFLSQTISKYLASWDFKYLFLSDFYGPDSWAVTNWGKLYLLDVPLIILGLVYLTKKNYPYVGLLLASLLLVSPLPDTFIAGPTWPVFRSVFIIPFLLILAAAGLEHLLSIKSKLKVGPLYIATYVLFTLPFFYSYFYEYPIQSKSDVYFYTRVVASYLRRIPDTTKVLILADESKHLFESIIFYNHLLTKDSYGEISSSVKSGQYAFRNFVISDACLSSINYSQYDLVLLQKSKGICPGDKLVSTPKNNRIDLASIVDSGSVFQLFNDNYCHLVSLPSYTHVTQSSQLDVEKLDQTHFCQTYFVKY